MRIYEKIKEAGRKYLAPAIVAGAIALGGCDRDNSLPISDKLRTEAKSQQAAYIADCRAEIEKVVGDFNEKIKDNEFTIDEQIEIYEQLKPLISRINRFEEGRQDQYLKSVKNMYSLLKKNYLGFDFGTPELEKELRKQGLETRVESGYGDSTIIIISLILSGMINMVRAFSKRSFGKR